MPGPQLFAVPSTPPGRWLLGDELTPPIKPGHISVHLRDGRTQTFAVTSPGYRRVVPGTLLYVAATEPELLERRFAVEPVQVLIEILRSNVRALNQSEVEKQFTELWLSPIEGWWTDARKALKPHPHVEITPTKLRWSETALDKSPPPRKRPAANKRSTSAPASVQVRRAAVTPTGERAPDAGPTPVPTQPIVRSPSAPDEASEHAAGPSARPLLAPSVRDRTPQGGRTSPESARAILAADLKEVEQLLLNAPLTDATFLAAWRVSLERTDPPDGIAKTELLLHRLLWRFALTPGRADTCSEALLLITALSTPGPDEMNSRLASLGRWLLGECLKCSGVESTLREATGESLAQLATSPFVGHPGSPTTERLALLLALDNAERGDVLESPRVWAGINLDTVVRTPALAQILARWDLGPTVTLPAAKAAMESERPATVLSLLGLPDQLTQQLPLLPLAKSLQSLTDTESFPGRVLQLLRERLAVAAPDSIEGQLEAKNHVLSVDNDRLRAALAATESTRDALRERVAILLTESRDVDELGLRQIRIDSLRLSIEIMEEVRLGLLSNGKALPIEIQQQLLRLAEAEGLKVEGVTDETIPYDPAQHRVLGATEATVAGVPVIVIRPVYVLVEHDSRTILRYGEVRLAAD